MIWSKQSYVEAIGMIDTIKQHSSLIGDDVFESLGTKNVVAKLMSYGSDGQKPVME